MDFINNHFFNKTFQTILLFVFLFLNSNLGFNQSCKGATDLSEQVTYRNNGKIDFTVIGATQNPAQNNNAVNNPQTCGSFLPITTTTATLNLNTGDEVVAAYLYWSGVGKVKHNVKLNDISVQDNRCWEFYSSGPFGLGIDMFSAFANVTNIVKSKGSGSYTFTGLNNTAEYQNNNCGGSNGSVLYGGWALVVIYESATTTGDYTIFLLDGFQSFQNQSFTKTLKANVFDDYEDSHVGVIAWEGDDYRFQGDSQDFFKLNGEILPSNGYTDPDNIFNGTNSFVNPVDKNFYNADFDDFDASDIVQGLLNTEAASFNFELKTGQDIVLLNTLIFRIPNQAPDATIEMPDEVFSGCSDDTRSFDIDFTYRNEEYASQPLPANTPINFYLGGTNTIIGSTNTSVELNPGQFATGTVTITIPSNVLGDFEVVAVIDDPNASAESYGTILELFEENNEFTSAGFIDQNYLDLEIEVNLCEGDTYYLGDGTLVTSNGSFSFDERTKRGNCDSIGVVIVNFNPSYDVQLSTESVCEGSEITKPDGEVLVLEPSEQPYEFTDNLKSIYGCDSVVHSSFLVKANQVGTFTQQICAGDEFMLPDNTTVSETGSYEITLPGAASNGCDSIVITNLEVLNIEFPNAFGPNGNGVNEGFRAIVPQICPDLISEYELKIFNRWGELVFQTNKIAESWPGIVGDKEGVQDFYIWHVKYVTNIDKTVNRDGGVTLVR